MRTLFFTLLLLMQAMFCFSQQEQLTKVNFLLSWVPQPQFAGYYMAREKGIYEKYGLDVNILSGGYGKQVPIFLQQGKADFGTIYLTSAIKQRADGNAIVNIGQIFQESGIMFVAKKKSNINSLKDFSGKKIAVWRTVLEEITVGFLKRNNITADIIRINEGVNIFLNDAVDICVIMYYNEFNKLINFGINENELSIFRLKDYGINFPEDGVYCMEEFYNENPELCKKFIQASIEGWEYAFANQEETLQVLRRIQKQEQIADNQTHLRWMLKTIQELVYPENSKVRMGTLSEKDFTNAIRFLINNNDINTEIKYNDFYRGVIEND